MSTYSKQTIVAKKLGYASPGLAIISIGRFEFLNKVKNLENSIDDKIVKIKKSTTTNKISIATVKRKPMENESSKANRRIAKMMNVVKRLNSVAKEKNIMMSIFT